MLEFTDYSLLVSNPDGLLTHDNYRKIGGASGAIGQWVNETYNGLSAEEKELSRKTLYPPGPLWRQRCAGFSPSFTEGKN